MDIIWNEDNFMEDRRPPHSDKLQGHLSQPVSALPPTEAVQSRRFRKTCERPPTSLSIFIGALRFEFDEFGSSMTRYFKRNMWRAGSGDGHYMEWRWFHGGSAAPTQRQAARPFISARVSFATNRGCSISTLQKNLRETADKSFHFHRCTTFWIWWIWVKYDKIFQKKHVTSRKWRWTLYGMKMISWRIGGPHTATSCKAIYLSPCQLCNQQRLFNLDASEKLAWDRRQVFPFS